jgi:hypothetical protein
MSEDGAMRFAYCALRVVLREMFVISEKAASRGTLRRNRLIRTRIGS